MKITSPRALTGAALLCALAAGCTPQQVQTATTDAQAVVANVQQACVSVQPLLAAGSSPVAPQTAQRIASYGNAVCGPIMAGSMPPTVNSTTPTWLGSLAGMLQVVLPVAAALL